MSKPIPFAPDVQYVLMGVGYEVIRVTADGNLLVKNLMTPQTQEQVHSMAVLRQYWHEGKLMFIIPEGANLRNSRESPFKLTYEFSDLSDIPLSLREETWNRYVLIKPLLALPKLERTKAAINNRIQEFFQEKREQEGQSSIILGRHIGKGVGPRKKKDESAAISGEKEPEDGKQDQEDDGTLLRKPEKENRSSPLTSRSVQRWIKRFRESGYDIRSLVPSYHRNGPQERYMIPVVQDLLKQAIRTVYSINSRDPTTKVIDEVKRLIKKKMKGNCPKNNWPFQAITPSIAL